MKKVLSFILIFLSFSLSSNAQKKGLASISQNDLKSYMTFFASDEMAGRETGTVSNDAAALYIKTNIMRLGLKPAPGIEDYLQKMPLVSTKINQKNSFLKIYNSQGEVIFSTDSLTTLIRPSDDVEFSGRLVFAGYGYADKATGYNDLNGVDLKDKIVLVMTRSPETVKSDSGKGVFVNTLEAPKIMSIISSGAKAVLQVYDPMNSFRDAYSSGLAGMTSSDAVTFKDQPEFSVPAQLSYITHNAANTLLRSTGSSLKQMQDKIASTGKPVSEELQDITVTIKTSVEKNEFSGSNVIGIVEGSDHVPFMRKGIPALCFHSGIHTDLHGPGDDVDKIDFEKMERVSKMVFLIGYKVANQRERIIIDNPGK